MTKPSLDPISIKKAQKSKKSVFRSLCEEMHRFAWTTKRSSALREVQINYELHCLMNNSLAAVFLPGVFVLVSHILVQTFLISLWKINHQPSGGI